MVSVKSRRRFRGGFVVLIALQVGLFGISVMRGAESYDHNFAATVHEVGFMLMADLMLVAMLVGGSARFYIREVRRLEGQDVLKARAQLILLSTVLTICWLMTRLAHNTAIGAGKASTLFRLYPLLTGSVGISLGLAFMPTYWYDRILVTTKQSAAQLTLILVSPVLCYLQPRLLPPLDQQEVPLYLQLKQPLFYQRRAAIYVLDCIYLLQGATTVTPQPLLMALRRLPTHDYQTFLSSLRRFTLRWCIVCWFSNRSNRSPKVQT